MATQLKDVDFTIPPVKAPAPLRPSHVAAVAASAVAPLPAGTPVLTLEEADILARTNELIVTAKSLLSPATYPAFLLWAERAAHQSTFYHTDAEGDRRIEATSAAITELSALPTLNIHDVLAKTYVLNLELSDSSSFGPMIFGYSVSGDGDRLLEGLFGDCEWLSPLPYMVDRLSRRAFEASRSRTAYREDIGAIITATLASARDAATFEHGSTGSRVPVAEQRADDAKLLSAFRDHHAEHIRYGEAPDGKEDDDLHHAELTRIEDIYLSTPAQTPAGLLGKLHTAFRGLEAGAWADDALVDPTSARFQAGIAKSDLFTRMLWSAVEDAARMSRREPTGKAW